MKYTYPLRRESVSNIKALMMAILMILCIVSGCIGENDHPDKDRISLTIAFEVSPNMLEDGSSPEIFADYISEISKFDITINTVDSKVAMLEALRFGNVDIAYMDSGNAWIGWNEYGTEVLAADQKSDGRSYYNANAWVLNDSDMAIAHLDSNELTNPFSLMESKASCHTGWLDSVGMMLPMGFLLGLGYANVLGDPNDIESLRGTIHGYFSDDSSIPDPGTPYYGESGALKCLSEGAGDIAFAKDNSIQDFCPIGDESPREDWCLENSRYVALPSFAKAPSDVFVYNPDYLDNETLEDLTELLTSLDEDTDSSEILSNTFGTSGVVRTNSDDHLGIYSSFVTSIPGISAYFVDEQDSEEEISISIEELRIAFHVDESIIGTDHDPNLLAGFLSDELGVNVSIIHVESESEKIGSLESGESHIAFMKHTSSLVAWKAHGLAVLAAIQNDDQTTSSAISGWSLSGSGILENSETEDGMIDPFGSTKGMVSCHTGTDPYTSSIAPLSYLIDIGHIVNDDSPSLSQELQIMSYFNDSSSIPMPNTTYFGESGAIRCLSEGYGEVAFLSENFISNECAESIQEGEDWCLGESNYSSLGIVGSLPSTSIMYNPLVLDTRSRASILNSLIDLNYDMYLENYSRPGFGTYTGCYDISAHKVYEDIPKQSCGDEILKNILNGPGIDRVNSQEHLGEYSQDILMVPGGFYAIEEYMSTE